MPNFAQNRQAVMNVLTDLLRPVARDLRVVYNMPTQLEEHSITMSFESAIAEMKNVLNGKPPQFATPSDYPAALRKAGINSRMIDLILTPAFLRPYQILTSTLKFEIDEAHALLPRLSQEQIAALAEIAKNQLPQFLLIYEHLHVVSSNSHGDTIANILSILQQVDADLKPWHVTELFSAKRMVLHTKQMIVNYDYQDVDAEGVDQCNRRQLEMSEKIYPQTRNVLSEVLKFTPREALSLSQSMDQFEIVEVLPFARAGLRDLLKEILFKVITQNSTALKASATINKQLQNSSSTFAFEFISRADVAKQMSLGMRLISKGMLEFIELSSQAVVTNKLLAIAKIDSIVAQLFVEFDAELVRIAVRERECNPILDCVIPFKLDMWTEVNVLNILGLPTAIVTSSRSSIEHSIASDLRSCDREFFDYPRITIEHIILERSYTEYRQWNFTGPMSMKPTQALLDALTTEDLIARDQKSSPTTKLFADYESYNSALQQCSIFYLETTNVQHSNRRLLATNHFQELFPVEPSTQSIFQIMTNSIADFVYDWLGKPILDAINESPTYFPPAQPNLWSQNSSAGTSQFGLFHVSRSHYNANIVPPMPTLSLNR